MKIKAYNKPTKVSLTNISDRFLHKNKFKRGKALKSSKKRPPHK